MAKLPDKIELTFDDLGLKDLFEKIEKRLSELEKTMAVQCELNQILVERSMIMFKGIEQIMKNNVLTKKEWTFAQSQNGQGGVDK